MDLGLGSRTLESKSGHAGPAQDPCYDIQSQPYIAFRVPNRVIITYQAEAAEAVAQYQAQETAISAREEAKLQGGVAEA
jgi:hypothetical protein